jgi:hypothetical protein
MKILKFTSQLIPSLLSGEKTTTWRLFDDKGLSLWDDLEFRRSEDNEVIGYGTIISLSEKKISEMNEEDCDGHEQFKNTEEIITNLKKYYGNNVDENSIIKIIHFSFKNI